MKLIMWIIFTSYLWIIHHRNVDNSATNWPNMVENVMIDMDKLVNKDTEKTTEDVQHVSGLN